MTPSHLRRLPVRSWIAKTVVLAALATLSGPLRAQDALYNGFDFDTEGWGRGWGLEGPVIDWDPTIDAKNDPASGSLRVTVEWASSTAWQEYVLQRAAGFDFTGYAKVAYDVKVDSASIPSTSGDYNLTQLALRSEGWGWNGWLTSQTIPGTDWVHVEELLPAGFSSIVAMNIGFGGSDFAGPITYWLDNVVFMGAENEPPPAMGIDRATPGLEVIATGAQYQRQSIRTTEPTFSWVNAGGPVEYALTIAKPPPAGSANFFAYAWLIGTDKIDPGTSPDWDEPHGVFLEIRPTAANTYDALLSFKLNAPGAHGTRFEPAGLLAQITNLTSVAGTWTIVMNGLNARLQTPDGQTGEGTLPAEAPEAFGNAFFAIGAQMDDTASRNRAYVFERIHITGPGDRMPMLDQDFTALEALDPTVWVNRAQDVSGIQLVPANTAYRLNWTAPAAGYELRASSVVTGGSWTDSALPVVIAGPRKVVYVPASALPSANAGFFELRKP